jgi:ribosomal protein L37AE/L43A
MSRRRRALLLVSIGVMLIAAIAEARPGGGHTYGGGDSPSSGSGWSGGGDTGSGGGGDDAAGAIFQILIWLALEHPVVGIPLLILFVVGSLVMHRQQSSGEGWSTRAAPDVALQQRMARAGAELDSARQRAGHQSRLRDELERLRQLDPVFSLIVFEDFLQALFTEVHVARGAGTLDRLSPWIAELPRHRLARVTERRVEAVVVGAMRYVGVSGLDVDAARVHVVVEFEANYTETEPLASAPATDIGPAATFWVLERWTLQRSRQAKSRPPKKARVFECPSCGAPLDKIVGATCTYCRNLVSTGDFDWQVTEIERLRREPRAPSLVGTTPERGTELATLIDPRAEQRFRVLTERDPALGWPALDARIRLVFEQLGRAWNEQDLAGARAYLADRLFETLGYWLDSYRRQGLRNLTEAARIEQITLARVAQDAHFDAITVRVFATSLDYTLDRHRRVVGGSKQAQRRYSEYWTLIRGVTVRGAPRSEPVCPNCGAPAAHVNQAGSCAHCGVQVTSGDFDWVLSRIEQDEAY